MKTNDPAGGLRVLLVDDHTIVREGLKRILGATHEGWVVSEEGSGFRALDNLRHNGCDLAIVDLSMPGMSGLELLHRIRMEWPHLPVLILSMHAEEEYALRAFKAGANGYVTKDSAAEELAAAALKVARGGTYVTTSLAERVVQELNGSVQVPRHARLTERELEVLRRFVAGERAGAIAAALHLSVKTISTHKTRIMDKLQAPSTAALVRYAMQHGLLPSDVVPPGEWTDSTAPGALD